MPSLFERARNSWNAFLGRDPTPNVKYPSIGGWGSGLRPDRYRLNHNNSRSIVSSIYNQIAVDVSSVDIRHVRVDDEDRYQETITGPLNRLFSLEANLDQTGRALIRDIVISMCDEGAVALVPTDTDVPPYATDAFKVYKARVGKIVEWYPRHVRVEVYNENTGMKEQIVVEKRTTPIFENPFYTTMNEPNSISQRLIRVLNQLDRTNEQNSAGKIDLLIQLPYAVRGETKTQQAEGRRKNLEAQLSGSQYGIGYIDVSEKVIQLNRSVENNLWAQAQDLLAQLYNQLGFSEKIFDGTADEATMLNYNNRTIEPFLSTIVEEITRKWISLTAQTQGQKMMFFRDPFKLVPVQSVADIADKFTRNEIMTSNEMRSEIGLKPSKDPKADELRNSNLNHPDENAKVSEVVDVVEKQGQKSNFDIDALLSRIGNTKI